MLVSKRQMFTRLYARDMERVGLETLGLAGAALVTVLLQFTPWTKNVAILPLVVVTGAAMLLPILTSILSLHGEWRENSIYLLLSLPVSGASVLGAKMLTALTQMLINSLIIAIMLIVSGFQWLPEAGMNWTAFWDQVMVIWQKADLGHMLPYVVLLGIVSFLYVLSGLQLGLLIGRLSRRFTALATIVSIIAVFWLSSNLYSALLSPFFPEQNSWMQGALEIQTLYWVLPSAALLVIAGIVFMGAAYIYNHRLEV